MERQFSAKISIPWVLQFEEYKNTCKNAIFPLALALRPQNSGLYLGSYFEAPGLGFDPEGPNLGLCIECPGLSLCLEGPGLGLDPEGPGHLPLH